MGEVEIGWREWESGGLDPLLKRDHVLQNFETFRISLFLNNDYNIGRAVK